MKQFTGIVLDKKMAKTARVSVNRIKMHPLYKKRMKLKKIYHVHDEFDTKPGDVVNFQDCKPISKTKKWRVIGVVKSLAKKTTKPVKVKEIGEEIGETKKESKVSKNNKVDKRKVKIKKVKAKRNSNKK